MVGLVSVLVVGVFVLPVCAGLSTGFFRSGSLGGSGSGGHDRGPDVVPGPGPCPSVG